MQNYITRRVRRRWSYKTGLSITGSEFAASALGTAFVVLKLCGVISWSWWWVLAPYWIPFCIGLMVILIFVYLQNRS